MKTIRSPVMRMATVQDYKIGQVLITARNKEITITYPYDIGSWWAEYEGEKIVVFESHKDMYRVRE